MHKLKSLMAKHRRQEAEFLRGIRISMYPIKEMPLTEPEIQAFKSAFILLATIVICTFMLVAGCSQASADTIPEDNAVKCILGEARGEGYQSMLAHAEAIRARGHLRGVYGCRAKISPTEAVYMQKNGIVALAQKAWNVSRGTSTVKGAQYWGSTIVDKAWIAKMERSGYIRTATIKNTAFYYNPKEK